MAAAGIAGFARAQDGAPALMLGGYAALAESAWMGAAHATEVLESLRAAQKSTQLPSA